MSQKFTALEKQSEVSVSSTESELLLKKVVNLEAELKQEKDLHKKSKEQVLKSMQSTASVAELELRDYQRTISQLNEKVKLKDELITRSAEQLNNLEKVVATKDDSIAELLGKVKDLTENCSRLEDDVTDARKQCADGEKVKYFFDVS